MEKLKPFIIYVFTDGECYYAIGRAKKGIIDNTYSYGFKIEKDPSRKMFNSKIHQQNRAKNEVITRVSNALNAIDKYGKKVLDRDGELSSEKYFECERKLADKYTPKNVGKKSFFDKKGNPRVWLNDLSPFKVFETKEITFDQAVEMDLLR